MKSLQTIQKTFRVFQILTKIAMILSFVWAGLTALGMLCAAVWYHGGIVVGASRELLFTLTETGGLAEMIGEMELNPGQMGLIVNRAPGGVLEDGVKAEIEKHGLKLFGVLPQDDAVYRCDCNGEPSALLPESDAMKSALKEILRSIGL